MRRLAALALAAACLAASAAAARAPAEPTAYGDARLGSLRVVSGVRVLPRAVDLRGLWLDGSAPCSQNRLLKVETVIDFTGGRLHRKVTRDGTFRAPNCAEGGPNVGFTPSARAAGLACPDGRWRPGRYSFATTTSEPRRGLRAVASLVWTSTRAC